MKRIPQENYDVLARVPVFGLSIVGCGTNRLRQTLCWYKCLLYEVMEILVSPVNVIFHICM